MIARLLRTLSERRIRNAAPMTEAERYERACHRLQALRDATANTYETRRYRERRQAALLGLERKRDRESLEALK